MSKIGVEGEITAKLKDEAFLYFAGNSSLGIVLFQRGYLIYFNKKFAEIFGYSEDEITKWKKREFYKIVHPEDLKELTQRFVQEDHRTVSVRFRGIKKNGEIILIENFNSVVYYNGKRAISSTYLELKELFMKMMYQQTTPILKESQKIVLDYHPETIKILENNNLKFDIIEHFSNKEED
ncbi:MAG: PAS domain-containing protein [Candidatus Hermodarchaeota archaeon]